MILAFLAAFLVGSVPAAWIVVRLQARKDVSSTGSGNVGAFNALRVTRSRWVGASVVVLDMAKGALAAWLVTRIGIAGEDLHLQCAATVGVVAGHNYNPWLSIARRRLTGGKGFAAAGGAFIVFCPWLIACWLGVCVGVYVLLRRAIGMRDEAPASAAATVGLVPSSLLIYDLPTCWMAVGLIVVIAPKMVQEVWGLLRSSPGAGA